MEAVLTQHIVMTPGVCGGKPRIDGTRIRVMDIVARHYTHRDSVEDILEQFPFLTAGQVFAALAFYHDNRELIDAAFEREIETERDVRTSLQTPQQ